MRTGADVSPSGRKYDVTYRHGDKPTGTTVSVYAKDFSQALATGGPVSVPCRGCNACCRSGYEITLEQGDAPELFTARNPAGVPMLPQRGDGSCAYLAGSLGCTVYKDRPRACRQFDCRSLAVTGVFAGTGPRDGVDAAAREWDLTSMIQTDEDAEYFVAARLAAESFVSLGVTAEIAAGQGIVSATGYLPAARAWLEKRESEAWK